MVKMFEVEWIMVTVMAVNTGVVVFEPQAVISGVKATAMTTDSKYPKNRICFLFIAISSLPVTNILWYASRIAPILSRVGCQLFDSLQHVGMSGKNLS